MASFTFYFICKDYKIKGGAFPIMKTRQITAEFNKGPMSMYNSRGTYLSATECSRIRHPHVKKTDPYCLNITSTDNFGEILLTDVNTVKSCAHL